MKTRIFILMSILFISFGMNKTFANEDNLFNENQIKEINREFTFIGKYLGNGTLELENKSTINFSTKYEKYLEIGDKVDLDVYGTIDSFRILDVYKNNKRLESDFTSRIDIKKIEKLGYKVISGKYGYGKIGIDERIHGEKFKEIEFSLDEKEFRGSYVFILLDKNDNIVEIIKYN